MADALYHLDVAQDLLSYAQTVSRQEAIPCIELAVSSLELYLTLPSALISLSDELFTRLLLAKTLLQYTTNTVRAEEVISKAVIKIGHQTQFIEYRLAFDELTCRILYATGSVNAAKKLARDSIAICEQHGQSCDKWRYTFLFKLFEMDRSHGAVRAIRALATSRRNDQMTQVADLLDSVLFVAQDTPVSDAVAPKLDSDLETFDTASLGMLQYLQLAISILGDVVAGNVAKTGQADADVKRALVKLALIHRGLDLDPNIRPSLDIPIPRDTRPDGPADTLTLHGFSTRRFMIFVYVLSGLVHLSEITSSRSEKFLAEGLRQLDLERAESRDLEADLWLQTMAEIIHIYKAFNHLLHHRFEACQASLRQTRHETPLVRLLRGSLAQQLGDLDAALELYAPLLSPITAPAETRRETANLASVGTLDIAVLAGLNTVLIHLGPSSPHHDRDRPHDLLLRLERYCQSGPLGTIFELLRTLVPLSSSGGTRTANAVNTVDASRINTNTTTNSTTTTLALKRALTRVLAAAKVHGNTQLNMIALSVLSLKGGDPGDMVLKFSSFAMNQANKSTSGHATAAQGTTSGNTSSQQGKMGASVWAALNGAIVEEVMTQKLAKSSTTTATGTDGTKAAELQERLGKVRAMNRRNEETMLASMPRVHKALFPHS